MCMMYYLYKRLRSRRHLSSNTTLVRYSMLEKNPKQLEHLRELYEKDDATCISQLQYSRATFSRLCYLLENVGGLRPRKYVRIGEQVAMFLRVLGHHEKNRTIGFHFKRSCDTVSLVFKKVLKAVLKLYPILLANPEPVADDCTSDRWLLFKGCVGALDGTYIQCQPRRENKPRFRTRKGDTAFNVLGVCNLDMKFIHVLSAWEGSTADSRVLRDVISHPGGLRVPRGENLIYRLPFKKIILF